MCPLAAEWKAVGTEENSEKRTTPAWRGSGLEGQRKLDNSQKVNMMARRTEMSQRHIGSKPNQFLPVAFAKQQVLVEPAKDLPMKVKRSEDYPMPL